MNDMSHNKNLGWMVLLLILLAGCSKQSQKAGHISRADKYFAAGDYTRAEIEYLNVTAFDAANAHAISRLAVIYFDEGRPVRAYPLLMRARELDPSNA